MTYLTLWMMEVSLSGREAAAAGSRYGGPRDAASSPGVRLTDQPDCPGFPSCLQERRAPTARTAAAFRSPHLLGSALTASKASGETFQQMLAAGCAHDNGCLHLRLAILKHVEGWRTGTVTYGSRFPPPPRQRVLPPTGWRNHVHLRAGDAEAARTSDARLLLSRLTLAFLKQQNDPLNNARTRVNMRPTNSFPSPGAG